MNLFFLKKFSFSFQLLDFDMCIAKNEEALRIKPDFSECYGNMANAWKVCQLLLLCLIGVNYVGPLLCGLETFSIIIQLGISLNAGKRQY